MVYLYSPVDGRHYLITREGMDVACADFTGVVRWHDDFCHRVPPPGQLQVLLPHCRAFTDLGYILRLSRFASFQEPNSKVFSLIHKPSLLNSEHFLWATVTRQCL